MRILDIGCGTGGHSLILAERGFEVTGIDISNAMIKIAKEKSKFKNLDIDFYAFPMETINLKGKWDSGICMFNALNYVVGADSIKKTLLNVQKLLEPGGLFLFDYRNGIPSIRLFSPTRVKWIENEKFRIFRISENTIDSLNQIFHTCHTVLVFEKNRIINEFCDKHIVLFFFPLDGEEYLETTGFEILNTFPFLSINGSVSEDDWNIMVVARKI